MGTLAKAPVMYLERTVKHPPPSWRLARLQGGRGLESLGKRISGRGNSKGKGLRLEGRLCGGGGGVRWEKHTGARYAGPRG